MKAQPSLEVPAAAAVQVDLGWIGVDMGSDLLGCFFFGANHDKLIVN